MSQYRDGTVNVTNSSATVTGVSTLWSSNLEAGDLFVRRGDNVTYTIASVDDDTTIQLSAPYAGITGSSVAYVSHRDFTPEGFPLMQDGDVETVLIYNDAVTLMSSYGSPGTEDNAGVVRLATQALAEAGTNDTRVMTPLKTSQHLTANTQTSATDTTAGALMPVGAFGLGALSITNLPGDDIDQTDIPAGISYQFDTGTVGDTPYSFGTVIMQRINPSTGSQLAIEALGDRISKRHINNGIWTDWQEIYHTGNLNTAEFGYGGVNDVFATGFATSATTGWAIIQLNTFGEPLSITIDGTIDVRDSSFTEIGTSLTAANVTLGVRSSANQLVLEITGLVGAVSGAPILLTKDVSNTSITVNF